ncbi:tRNA pseudouridine(55) synthase TruB [Pseudobutyrivibrio xylanivorans]|uniref:tRNA pseudouridine synthase B n=1 Tax=Pseudobutyrivibrio xylanivorans DSM 14809 TaxID=1123012 RepID=A0A1M6BTW6_PSEXY|nr:tRNA pseudouridine(55) synthase TruB [Pseudobutyrivibrio xylanivorans]SHI52232.1 tRNA pseudouridine55 synthase [Pseudobutyrivibrio xylanivorans DSM 14809]
MNSGIINVYKEAGFTSFDVVAKLRGILKIKKIGHTGTLDPDATGVLPVCIGKATKLCDMLTDKDKVYECVMLLGVETDTYDMSGRILEKKSVDVTEAQVQEALSAFVGDIMQVPPMYSALKINGKKLYELAREGKEVERKPRPVTIFSIDILSMKLPEVSIRIHCSKGTYIRSLCHDVGEKLGCGCAMKSLVRTRVSQFDISDAKTLDEIERIVKNGKLDGIMLPIASVFDGLGTVFVIPTEEALKQAINGGKIPAANVFAEAVSNFEDGERYRIFLPDNRFLGIYVYEESQFILEKMFLE